LNEKDGEVKDNEEEDLFKDDIYEWIS